MKIPSTIEMAANALVWLSVMLSVCAFDDPISILGRIRWNYTSYEENLWTRQFKNTTLEQIYHDHNDFINTINKGYDINDRFYPTINASAVVGSIKQVPIVDAFLINPHHVPLVHDVILANVQVEEYWTKFSNWSSYNATNMLDVLTDDAIPTLQNTLDIMWNATNTAVYFDFLKTVSLKHKLHFPFRINSEEVITLELET